MKSKKMANDMPVYHSASKARAYVKSFENLTEQEKTMFYGLIKKYQLRAVYKGVATILHKRFDKQEAK